MGLETRGMWDGTQVRTVNFLNKRLAGFVNGIGRNFFLVEENILVEENQFHWVFPQKGE